METAANSFKNKQNNQLVIFIFTFIKYYTVKFLFCSAIAKKNQFRKKKLTTRNKKNICIMYRFSFVVNAKCYN